MTIEKARQQIKAHRIPMEDLLDELEWYREQDLIRREDAIAIFKDNFYRCHENSIKQIPKAEPKKKETINEIRAKYGLAPISQWKPPTCSDTVSEEE